VLQLIFNTAVKMLENREICWRYDPHGAGYRLSHFLEDGRTLPAMNEDEERLAVVPAGDVASLLKQPPR
jgi:hypothetical protein